MATPNFVPPFTLIHEGGRTYVYDDLAALEEGCRAGGIFVGDGHKQPIPLHDRLLLATAFRHNEWIVRDHFGRTVTMADIRAVRTLHPYRWDYRRDAQVMAYERGLPIPYVGGGRARGRSMYRHPRHMGVYREAEISRVVEREEGWKVRGKIMQPPNAWDDICASDWGHRTWKRSRRTRWRKPAVSFRMLVREEEGG